jgi:tripartite-type tricarboxylate transporter receptor subunit TctC
MEAFGELLLKHCKEANRIIDRTEVPLCPSRHGDVNKEEYESVFRRAAGAGRYQHIQELATTSAENDSLSSSYRRVRLEHDWDRHSNGRSSMWYLIEWVEKNGTAAAIAISSLLGLMVLWPAFACAQASYPSKPVRWVVPSSPGGGLDIMTRMIGQKLSERTGVSFVVDNRPGGSGIIGNDVVVKSAPDGYTLVTIASTVTILPYLMKKIPYELSDFTPVTVLASVPNVLVVHPSVPANSVAEFIALARERPGKLAYGSAGEGSSPHMSVEALLALTKVDVVHVPYKGTGPAMLDLIAGRTQFMMANVLSIAKYVESKRLRALGVTSAKRSVALPDVPPIGDAVPGYAVVQWYGMAGPKGIPREVVTRLQREVAAILHLPDIREKLTHQGAEPGGDTPEEFAAMIRSESKRWGEVARSAGLTPR